MKTPAPARHLNAIPPYSPGLSKDEIARRFGVEKPIKLASNENPLGPSPMALSAMNECLWLSHLYTDPMASELRESAAGFFGFPAENIITGNGSDEIIDFICRAYLNPGDKVAIPSCTFSYYRIAVLACGGEVIETSMDGMRISHEAIVDAAKSGVKIIFISNPNNPTGTYIESEKLIRIVDNISDDVIIVLDEAYSSFSRAKDFLSGLELLARKPNVIVINTLSKSHGLAGIRVGFAIACRPVIDNLFKVKPPFNMNLMAIKAGAAALKDSDFYKKTLETTWNGLDYLYSSFDSMGLTYVESHTNFVLVKLGKNSKAIYEELLKRGIITRYMQALGDYIRVSIGLDVENKAFIEALKNIINTINGAAS